MSESNKDQHGPIIAFAVTVCFLIFALIGWYEGFKRGQESQQDLSAEAYTEQAEIKIQKTCLVLSGAAQAECIGEAVSSTREHQRAEEDLDAQQQMAEWARWMLISTIVMAFVTALGVVFVWQTLKATQIMASDTREIGEAQVRSYVYANVAEIDVAQNTLDVIFKNFGNTPGSISFIDCYVLVSDPYASKIIWSQKFWSDGWTVAPQDTMREKFRLDTGRADYLVRMIREAGIHVCVQGNFQTVDVFKRTHLHGINIVLSDGIIRT